jgi:hypothetical protein
MEFSRSLDAFFASAIVIAASLIAAAAGFPKLIGCFLILPSASLGIFALLRVKPLFLSGSCLAICTANFIYVVKAVSASDINSSGSVVMFLAMSTGSGFIGAILAGLLLRRCVSAGPVLALIVGFAGVSVGFFFSQLTICNSVMWCDPLSFPLK